MSWTSVDKTDFSSSKGPQCVSSSLKHIDLMLLISQVQLYNKLINQKQNLFYLCDSEERT